MFKLFIAGLVCLFTGVFVCQYFFIASVKGPEARVFSSVLSEDAEPAAEEKSILIRVRVQEIETQIPVPGIAVTFEWKGKRGVQGILSGVSDDQGLAVFRVASFEQGFVWLNERFFEGRTLAGMPTHSESTRSKPVTRQKIVHEGKDLYEVVLQAPLIPIYKGAVLDSLGRPVPGAVVLKEHCMGRKPEISFREDGTPDCDSATISDENGRFRIEGERGTEGSIVFAAFHKDFGLSDWYWPQVEEEKYTLEELSLVLSRSAFLEFEVVDSEGRSFPDIPLRVCETEESLQQRGADRMIAVPSLFRGQADKEGNCHFILPCQRAYRLLDCEAYPFRISEIEGQPIHSGIESTRSVYSPIILREKDSLAVKVILPRQTLRGRVIDERGDPVRFARVYQQNRHVACTDQEGGFSPVKPQAGSPGKNQAPLVWLDHPLRIVKKGFQTRNITVPHMQDLGEEGLIVVLESKTYLSSGLQTTPPALRAFLIDRDARGKGGFPNEFYGSVIHAQDLEASKGSFLFRRVEHKPYDLVMVLGSPAGGHEGAWVISDYRPVDLLDVRIPGDLFSASLEGAIAFPAEKEKYQDLCIHLRPRSFFDPKTGKMKQIDYLTIDYRFPSPTKDFFIPELQPGIYDLTVSAFDASEGIPSPCTAANIQKTVILKEGPNRIDLNLISRNEQETGTVVVSARMPDGSPAESFELTTSQGNLFSSKDGKVELKWNVGQYEFCVTDEPYPWNAIQHGDFFISPNQTTEVEVQLDWID
ncbi:MAG: hypothetical protein ABIK28_25220 [Planctomycetota bacterium]